jgi:hypothetical protein
VLNYTKQTWEDNNPAYPASAERFRHMDDGLSAVSNLVDAGRVGDTGWVALSSPGTLTFASGWTAYAAGDMAAGSRYRVLNGVCTVQIGLTSPSDLSVVADAAGNIGDTTAATVLPAAARPIGNTVWGTFGRLGYAMSPAASLNTAGVVMMRGYFPSIAVPAGVPTGFFFMFPVG